MGRRPGLPLLSRVSPISCSASFCTMRQLHCLELAERLQYPLQMRMLAAAHPFIFRALQCPLVSLPRLKNRELRFDRDARSFDHIHWPPEPARRGHICLPEMKLITHCDLPCFGLCVPVSLHSVSAAQSIVSTPCLSFSHDGRPERLRPGDSAVETRRSCRQQAPA